MYGILNRRVTQAALPATYLSKKSHILSRDIPFCSEPSRGLISEWSWGPQALVWLPIHSSHPQTHYVATSHLLDTIHTHTHTHTHTLTHTMKRPMCTQADPHTHTGTYIQTDRCLDAQTRRHQKTQRLARAHAPGHKTHADTPTHTKSTRSHTLATTTSSSPAWGKELWQEERGPLF